jgi:hypothetical protein
MKSGAEMQSVRDKIAFFDKFVLDQIGVDPKQVRAAARKSKVAPGPTAGAPPPPPPLDRGAMLDAARDAALDATEGRDKPVDDGLGLGLTGKKLGEKYVGEEKGEGWRAAQNATSMTQFVKTKHFSDRERDDSKLLVGPDGRAMAGIGIDTGTDNSGQRREMGFVMNPETGDTHLFREVQAENRNNGKLEVTVTHHSSPLQGGDVAGAGKILFDRDERIDVIKDQSGHYKPNAEITFQAVRQLSMLTLSGDIQSRLRKRGSTLGQEEGGTAESPDSIEQLIAQELGVARDAFFAALDAEQEKLALDAESIGDQGQREARMEQINLARRDGADAFRAVAAEVEAELRNQIGDTANGALLQSDKPGSGDDGTVKTLRKQANMLRDAIEDMQDREPGDGPDYIDPALLAGKLRQLDTMRQALAPQKYDVHEAKVSLLGKTGALGDDEYQAAIDAGHAKLQARADAGETVPEHERRATFGEELNKATVLKQLRAPLGGAAFGALVSSGKLGEEMQRRGLVPGEPGAVDKLRDLLGNEEVERIKDDPDALARLADEHDVKRLDTDDILKGPEILGFELGKATSETMYASQFLQTGGNERQIRAKSAVLSDIEDGGRPTLRATGSKASQEIEAKRQAMLPGGADREQPVATGGGSPSEARRNELVSEIAQTQAHLHATADEENEISEKFRAARETVDRLTGEIEVASDELERLRKAGRSDDDDDLRKLAAEVEALDRERDQAQDEQDEFDMKLDVYWDMRDRLKRLRDDLVNMAPVLKEERKSRAANLLDNDPVLRKVALNEKLSRLERGIKKIKMKLDKDGISETERKDLTEDLASKNSEAEKARAEREQVDQAPVFRIPVLRRQLDALEGRIEQASGEDRKALAAEAAPLRAEMEKLMAAG